MVCARARALDEAETLVGDALRDAPRDDRVRASYRAVTLARVRHHLSAQKLQEDIGISFECADCWAADAVCSKNNCPMCVFSPHGEKCTECARTHCSSALYACTGLPDWVFPP